MQKFSEFLEYSFRDIYGFEKPTKSKPPEEELPITSFNTSTFMNYLEKDLGNKKSRRAFVTDTIQYGIGSGSIRIRLTPNNAIDIQRLIFSLDGNETWITKRLFKIKTLQYAGKEDVVAKELFRHLEKINREQIDNCTKTYKDLFALCKRVYDRVNKANSMFFPVEIKKVKENNYNILLSISGYGQGKIIQHHAGTPASVIDLSFNENSGLIKGMFYTISASGESGAWEIDIPYFTGFFTGTQDLDEIADAVINGIKFI